MIGGVTEASPTEKPYDSLLVVSFGGPEGPDDVMPFLRNVVRGRDVPDERLQEVAEHYYQTGGKSPINEQNRALIAALRSELTEHGPKLPVYWGNRNWHPMLADTLRRMKEDGCRKALAFVTSAYSSYSGCRQYRENIEAARAEIEAAPEVDKLRVFFNHPGFVEPVIERVEAALESLPAGRRDGARIAFTAHSIPVAMAEHCDYEAQLEEVCTLVAAGVNHSEWQLVYQSRSGPEHVPWLEPDILEHIRALEIIGVRDLVVVPIGFVSDHMEVIWDLDHEAQELCEELDINYVRAGTVGVHPQFVSMIRELVLERCNEGERRRSLGKLGARPDVCAPDCCPPPERKSKP